MILKKRREETRTNLNTYCKIKNVSNPKLLISALSTNDTIHPSYYQYIYTSINPGQNVSLTPIKIPIVTKLDIKTNETFIVLTTISEIKNFSDPCIVLKWI